VASATIAWCWAAQCGGCGIYHIHTHMTMMRLLLRIASLQLCVRHVTKRLQKVACRCEIVSRVCSDFAVAYVLLLLPSFSYTCAGLLTPTTPAPSTCRSLQQSRSACSTSPRMRQTTARMKSMSPWRHTTEGEDSGNLKVLLAAV
jgi:hypothetical protein